MSDEVIYVFKRGEGWVAERADAEAKRRRQAAKAMNFGMPGHYIFGRDYANVFAEYENYMAEQRARQAEAARRADVERREWDDHLDYWARELAGLRNRR